MKTKKIFALSAVLGIFALSPVLAENPIISQKYTADPTAIVWNDRVYVYCSNDDNNPTSGGYDIKAYTLVSSDDMANWTDHGEVFRVPRDLSVNNQAYAPGAAVKNGKVYLYVPDGGSKIGVAVANRPEGEFTGGKSLITKVENNNTNVPWLFDPAAFVDTDGQAYIYFGGGPSDATPGPGQNLRGAKLGSDMMSVQYPATTISDSRSSFEAAFVHKRGSTYYFTYSTNFSNSTSGVPNGSIAYLTSNNPLTGFTYKGIMLPGTNIGGNNHAAPLEYKDKWYLFYHDRKLKNNSSNRPPDISTDGERRSVGVDILEYNADGTMKQVTTTVAGPAQIKNLNPYDTVRAVTINTMSGIRTAASTGGNGNEGGTGKEGRQILTQISNNDWIRVKGVDFGSGAAKVKVRAAAANGSSGSIEFRTGSNTGTLIGTCNITSTGSWTTWNTFECDVNVSGVKDFLYLVFKGSASELFRLDWYIFEGASQTVSSSSAVPSSSSSAVESSSSSEDPQICGEYETSFCGGMAFADVLDNSTETPTAGQCIFIEDFGIIQPWLSSTISINGIENVCGSEWDGCGYNAKPATKDGGYYVYVETGRVNKWNDNDDVVAKTKPECGPTPIAHYPQPVVNSKASIYYTIKGEPVGSTKPTKSGVYLVKEGSSVRKIVVR